MEDNLPIADDLARQLAENDVDPNEAQKALAYMRSKGESKALFDYLQTITKNGGAVIRSGRTMGYYRNLQTACNQHLRPLEKNYEALLWTFGWSLRLLRYYRAVPESLRSPEPIITHQQPTQRQPQRQRQQPAPSTPAPTNQQPPSPPTPTAPAPTPEELSKPVDLRRLGVIVDVATAGDVGVLEDGDGKTYRYAMTDIIGEPPGELDKVRFNASSRKVPVKKGKKNVPWAENVEKG